MKFSEINQQTAAHVFDRDIPALLPVGAIEVHGNHLPLGTDAYLASALTDKIEKTLGKDDCVVLPALPYGQVWSLGNVKGSIDIGNQALSLAVVHICKSLAKIGCKRIALINAHVGNLVALKEAQRTLCEIEGLAVYVFTYPGSEEKIKEVCTSKRVHPPYFHACEIETSYMLCLCPQYVDMGKAISQYPDFPADFDFVARRWDTIMKTAVLGDATAATEAKGQAILEAVIKNITAILNGAGQR
jgi:creatinine amidohydrolase